MIELAATGIQRARTPVLLCALVGLGGLFAGVTGPLLSNFVPLIVRDAVGEHRTAIGGVMAIDNVLLLLLVPWAGAASDRARARGRGRLHIVLGAFLLAAAGMALFPLAPAFGLPGIIAAIVVLHTGINAQRSPFHALMTDLVPSRDRSLANGSVTFQMCVGAIVFLMLGKILGMRPAFFVAAGTVLVIVALFGFALPRLALSESQAAEAPRPAEATYRSLLDAVWSAIRGVHPGLRAVFIATFLQQLTFQTFTTWFALHGTERFGVRPEDVTSGFIAWAMGGVIGALPAGVIGVRIGRRNAMLLGFAMMAVSLLALDRVTQLSHATGLLALAAACWTLPMVNAYPLFVEPVSPASRGVLTSLFVLCMALGGGIGDPLNGAIFDLADGYRPMFVMMAGYVGLAFLTVLFIPRGAGEAATA